MHLSTTQTRALGDVMRLLAEASDPDALRADLALPMLDLLHADTYASFTWDTAAHCFARVKALNMSEDNLRSWDEHYRFVDPLTFPMMERRHPTLATQILCQQDLSRTEFFNDFLKRDRMHWGVNVYVFADGECTGDMRIWRHRERGNFDVNELEVLRLVEPAFAAALARFRWEAKPASLPRAREGVSELLQRRSALSQREAEAAALILSGCPDKLIAKRMEVGLATVRFHLTNAFRKLHVDNRTQLAARVQALVNAEASALGTQ
ncbi:LuxR C-terminal-related transcriptional regulator [Variovorax sp. EBFNA2]|uniref:helix-turn-helix transcriptional regulator n=1 Tax=Variovorax sp. EBFNA2 TaxID=3342097 RepID=UPI0029C06553|nr:LuxR C-terminal-related transcriptional regulator [Variovorax boronicumulans]WPG41238.1 LuxR C-terminal-related transcriptional regulator [Variovorax boronicumulans]